MGNDKMKKIVLWIGMTWILPIVITYILTTGIVYFCLKMELKFALQTSVFIIYFTWAIIITFRSILWASKKIKEIK